MKVILELPDMPSSCWKCPLSDGHENCLVVEKCNDYTNCRQNNCPICGFINGRNQIIYIDEFKNIPLQ